MYGYAHLNACTHRNQIYWCTGTGLTSSCEPPNVGAGIWTWVFSQCTFNIKLFLQAPRLLRLLAIYLYIMAIFVSWLIDTKIVSERRYTIMVTGDKDELNYIVLAYYFLMHRTFFPHRGLVGRTYSSWSLAELGNHWICTEIFHMNVVSSFIPSW